MIKINLLPYRAARKKENIRRQISLFSLFILFIAVSLLYYNTSLKKKIDVLNKNIENTKMMLVKVEKQAKRVDQIKNMLNKLKKKTNVIKNLEANRKASVQMLDNMIKIVAEKTSNSGPSESANPDKKPVKRLWFTSFQAKGKNITINGIALDSKTVADFMSRLEDSKLYKNVHLKTLKRKELNKLKLKSFEITCTRIPLKKKKKST